ncbi:Hypothetical predicted protein [Lecanosticta acicola]|uniref:Xylose isomerase-like TIM barrel domain-containing protein n=1 Tax=Lecanosticta acicola TaxID=111012 RepID=A0AAI8Z0C0_9PEZI|nr:Hypothetical predicted protein [Lecanosticta acicola]
MDDLSSLPLSYASVSIGYKPAHTLPLKLDAIASAGFQAIELGMPDLVSFANLHFKTDKITDHAWEDLTAAARALKPILSAKNLKVLMLQPFANFEGWAENSPERKDAWERVENWTNIMQVLGCDMLQVGSSDSPPENIGTDRGRFVEDLRQLADVLDKKGMRIAYENWCWSTHAPDWKDVWEICKDVDRGNFGLCLDTFQSAGGEWGDPRTRSGIVEDGRSREEVTRDWKRSCAELSNTIPKEKIFLLQISDAYRLKEPLEAREIDGMRPRARWSHDFRPLPFDEGYLPVVDFTRAVLDTGFRGWFSYEIFDGGPDGKGKAYELEDLAQQAMGSQGKLVEAVRDA